MSILGENFDPTLIKQIEVRETELGKSSLTPKQIVYNNSRTAWIRAVSGVNVKDSIPGISLTGDSNNYAQKFVLFGGVATSDGRYADKAFATSDSLENQVASAYGVGNATLWGASPPPGIRGLEVKELNKGSIRKATLLVEAHNPSQFQLIEALYLKLGFTILVEWGHSMYLDNNFQLQQLDTFNTVPFTNYLDADGGGYNKLFELNQDIQSEIQKRSHNYDGFIGTITNFNWSISEAGVYNISIDTFSHGSLIESLTVSKTTALKRKTDEQKGFDTSGDNLTYLLRKAKLILKGDSSSIPSSPSNGTTPGGLPGSGDLPGGNRIKQSLSTATNKEFRYNLRDAKSLFQLPIIEQGELVNYKTIFDMTATYAQPDSAYITLGLLLRTIESEGLYYDNSGEGIIKIDSQYKNSWMLSHPYQQSVDPRVCILTNEYVYMQLNGDESEQTGPPNPNNWSSDYTSNNKFEVTSTPYNHVNSGKDLFRKNADNGFQGDIMGILVNIDFVLQTMQNSLVEGQLPLFSFLDSLLKEISSCIGSINSFEINYNDSTRTLSIYDDSVIPGIKPKRPTTATFNILGFNPKEGRNEGSFVKNFSFSSKIFPSISNVIAISAQSGQSPLPEKVSSLQKLNQGIEDRILKGTVRDTPNANERDVNTLSKYEQDVANLNNFFDITYNQQNIQPQEQSERFKTVLTNVLLYDLSLRAVNEDIAPPFVIPVELSLTLDGISGVKKFQKFDVTPDYILPPSYPNNLNYIVQGIDNSIKDGEWTTTLNTLFYHSNEKSTYGIVDGIFYGTKTTGERKPTKNSSPNSTDITFETSNPTTELKFVLGSSETIQDNFSLSAGPTTVDTILTMIHPKFRFKFRDFFSRLQREPKLKGATIQINSGFRTFAQQSLLRRTNPRAAKPGLSPHNYGVSLDFQVNDTATSEVLLGLSHPIAKWVDSGIVDQAQLAGVNRWGGYFGHEFSSEYDPIHFDVNINKENFKTQTQEWATANGKDFNSLTNDDIFSIKYNI